MSTDPLEISEMPARHQIACLLLNADHIEPGFVDSQGNANPDSVHETIFPPNGSGQRTYQWFHCERPVIVDSVYVVPDFSSSNAIYTGETTRYNNFTLKLGTGRGGASNGSAKYMSERSDPAMPLPTVAFTPQSRLPVEDLRAGSPLFQTRTAWTNYVPEGARVHVMLGNGADNQSVNAKHFLVQIRYHEVTTESPRVKQLGSFSESTNLLPLYTPLEIDENGVTHAVPHHFQDITVAANSAAFSNGDDFALYYAERNTVIDSIHMMWTDPYDDDFSCNVVKCDPGVRPRVADGTAANIISTRAAVNGSSLPGNPEFNKEKLTLNEGANFIEAGKYVGLAITGAGTSKMKDLVFTIRIRTAY